MFLDLVRQNRSYRRFDQSVRMTADELRSCIDAARLSASGGNVQALRFVIVDDKKTADAVFETLAFAAYLKEWDGPAPTERPTAYILIMLDGELAQARAIDMGIAAQSILLRAAELGFGGCMFRSFKRAELDAIVARDPYHTELVIALGKPDECVQIVDCEGDIKYYREGGVHYVPKRSLDDLII